MSDASRRPIRTATRVEGITYAVRDVVATARKAQAAGKDLIYLNIGDPCLFDFETPPKVRNAIVRAIHDNKTSYSPSEGIPQALEAIRRDAETRKGIRGIRDILIGHGASEPIEAVLTALVEPGEGVLVPTPGYPLYTAVLAKLQARAIPYDLDEACGWQPDPQEIASRIDSKTRAIVLINPNNPTGSIADRKTLGAILEMADRHALVVLSDEIYDRMVLDPVEMVSAASLRDDVPIVTFGGLSKVWLGPGLRIGWSITSGPEAVVAPLVEAMGKIMRARLCANHPVQWAIAPALEGPNEHILEVNEKLRRRRDLTAKRLAEIPGWELAAPRAAFYAFPTMNLGKSDEQVVQELILQQGVVLVHGSGFGQKDGTNHARIVFLPQEDLLDEAYSRIAAYTAGL